jgi:hypothetical protein
LRFKKKFKTKKKKKDFSIHKESMIQLVLCICGGLCNFVEVFSYKNFTSELEKSNRNEVYEIGFIAQYVLLQVDLIYKKRKKKHQSSISYAAVTLEVDGGIRSKGLFKNQC